MWPYKSRDFRAKASSTFNTHRQYNTYFFCLNIEIENESLTVLNLKISLFFIFLSAYSPDLNVLQENKTYLVTCMTMNMLGKQVHFT